MLQSQRNFGMCAAKAIPAKDNPMPEHIKTEDDLREAMMGSRPKPQLPPPVYATDNPGGSGARDEAQANRELLLSVIRDHGPISRAELREVLPEFNEWMFRRYLIWLREYQYIEPAPDVYRKWVAT